MFIKQLKYATIGAFIGIVAGLIVGVMFINYNTTKGQRGLFSDGAIIAVACIFCIVGVSIGASLATEAHKEEVLGLNNLNESMFKSGRYWTAMTSWKEPKTDKEIKLITEKNFTGALISTINSKTIINHPTTSGSEVNVRKYHNEAKLLVFKAIKHSFGSAKTVEELF